MTSITFAHFVKPAADKKPITLLPSRIPSFLYERLVASHLTTANKRCLEFAKSRDLRSITKKELDEADKCDVDCVEEERWYANNQVDEYDEEYGDDFSAQWGESDYSDSEVDFVDNEPDRC